MKEISRNLENISGGAGWGSAFGGAVNGGLGGYAATGGSAVGAACGAAAGAAVGALGGTQGGQATFGAAAGVACANASAGGGGGGGGRVICTHLMRQGLLDPAIWRADLAFTYKHLSPTTVRGYHLWAIPYVRLMRKSPLAQKLMRPLATWRAEELAFQMGVLQKKQLEGQGRTLDLRADLLCTRHFCQRAKLAGFVGQPAPAYGNHLSGLIQQF